MNSPGPWTHNEIALLRKCIIKTPRRPAGGTSVLHPKQLVALASRPAFRRPGRVPPATG